MTMRTVSTILVLLSPLFVVYAHVPQLINYQGMLSDAEGEPVDGPLSIQFTIWDAAVEGTSLWTETQSVTLSDGVFNVLLGSSTAIPFNVFDGNIRYLAIKIGDDPELTPRRTLVSVAYAYKADDAQKLEGQSASSFLNSTNDYGRSGVASDLYEGTSMLSDKYVNEGQLGTPVYGNGRYTNVFNLDFVLKELELDKTAFLVEIEQGAILRPDIS